MMPCSSTALLYSRPGTSASSCSSLNWRASAASKRWVSFSRSIARGQSASASDTGGQSCSGVGSPVASPLIRWRAISDQAVMCSTSSQMLCALAIGRRRARPASTPSRTSASAGPCHIGPVTVRSIWLDSRLARLINYFLLRSVLLVHHYAQPQVRPPDAVQDPLCHDRGHLVAGAGHRRERGDLLAVQPAPDETAAGARAAPARQSVGAGAETGIAELQPGRRLRDGLKLPDVPRPREDPDSVHGDRRTPVIWRQPERSRPDAGRRGHARLRQLLSGARPLAGDRT